MRNKRLIILFSILLSITLIVLIGSIIFSVKPDKVKTYCYNYLDDTNEDDGTTLSQRVLSHVNIDNKSVFLLNEKKIIEEIEKNVADVKVINIERKFPNRVTVNYIKLFDYFQVNIDGQYYLLRHDGRITDITDEAQSLIEIRCGVKGEFNKDEFMFTGADAELLKDIAVGLETLGLDNYKAPQVVKFIDIIKSENLIYLGMANGTIIQIWGRDNLSGKRGKLRMGISTYAADQFDPVKFKMIVVVWDNNKSKATAFGAPKSDY